MQAAAARRPTQRTAIELCDFIHRLSWADAPEHVRVRVLALVRDMAAVCAAGRRTPVAALGVEYAHQQHVGKEATLLFDGTGASASGAALANGLLANALDFDDGHRLVSGHPGAVVIPAALAAAQRAGASRAETLAAILLGYEVAIRAGLELHARSDSFHYHATGAWGSIGAAAAAARLFGLDTGQIAHALGLAEYHAPIALVMRSAAEPAMTKDGCAWGAYVGVSSALLVEHGFTATSSRFADDRSAHDDLGREWRVEQIYVKPFPCCRWTHAALEAACALKRDHRIRADDIRQVVVRTFAAADELGKGTVTNSEEAQYSVAWPVAAALVRGDFGVEHSVEPGILDPAVAALRERVELVVDKTFSDAYPARRFAEVLLRTHDDEVLRSGIFEPRGEPEDERWEDVIETKVARHAPWLISTGGRTSRDTPQGLEPFAWLLEESAGNA